MSSVGLPRVPSARSSSRGSLRSAGSEMNSQRSGSSSAEADQYSDDEDKPQEGGILWQEVETFLNKPAPSLNIITKGDNLNREMLPKIKDERSSLRKVASNEPQFDDTAFRKKAVARTTSGPAQPKGIDPKLLQEAFAYAQKVQMQSMDDSDDDEQDNGSGQQGQRGQSNARVAAPFIGAGEVAGTKNSARIGSFTKQTSSSKLDSDIPKKKKSSSSKSSSKTSAYAVQAKAKSSKNNKKQREQQWDMTNSSPAEAAEVNRKASMDPQMMQALVSNFQNGTSLDELRRELAASQQSMAASRAVIQDAAKSFFGGRY